MTTLHKQGDLSEDFQKGIICDLHAHSSYAGGTGSLDLQTAVINMPKKGVKLIGTGDCLFEPWLKTLKEELHDPTDSGVFELKTATEQEKETKFVLQTELAFTAPIDVYRKNVHCVFLWPNFDAVDEAIQLLEKFKVKNSMGRPFITNDSAEDISMKLNALLDIDPLVEFFPAHVLVPLGIYGPKPAIVYMEDFFGEVAERIHAFETGLSADPTVTGLIPELDKLTLLSNSDAHSAALNRLGRELTSLDMKKLTYQELITAIRENKVCYTAEFHPSEGRYFLTGHRGGIRNHKADEFCVYSPDMLPADKICPLCDLTLVPGVLQRAIELSQAQGSERVYGEENGPKRNFYRMVPLAEIIAQGLGVKGANTKGVRQLYDIIIGAIGNECKLWTTKLATLEGILTQLVDAKIAEAIVEVRKGNFCFSPPGFDGSYGELTIGQLSNYSGIKIVQGEIKTKKQMSLDDFTS
ncbi:MAG: endonuclease Q family protein [Candidatus Heimdallarchaeota archaeon]